MIKESTKPNYDIFQKSEDTQHVELVLYMVHKGLWDIAIPSKDATDETPVKKSTEMVYHAGYGYEMPLSDTVMVNLGNNRSISMMRRGALTDDENEVKWLIETKEPAQEANITTIRRMSIFHTGHVYTDEINENTQTGRPVNKIRVQRYGPDEKGDFSYYDSILNEAIITSEERQKEYHNVIKYETS